MYINYYRIIETNVYMTCSKDFQFHMLFPYITTVSWSHIYFLIIHSFFLKSCSAHINSSTLRVHVLHL